VIIERIRLRNFKCYGAVETTLETGVTVIHGPNGSGKSTLLEACFFALYGASALDTTLDEVVTVGETEMAVEVAFRHAGESFHIEREVRVSNGRARTTRCVMETPSGPVEGARDVRRRVGELLRMDATAFVNCAYVRQGEVNKLIEASPGDRQDMLDDLLQLGRLETYRERASKARVGVKRVLEEQQGALAELDEQLAAKEEQNLHEQRNECLSELADLEEKRDRFEQNRENARETLDQAAEILDEHETRREQLAELEDSIEELRGGIRETEREREQLADRIEACRAELAAARERRDAALDGLAGDEDRLAGIDPSDDDLREAVEAELSSVRSEIEAVTEQIRELSVTKQEHEGERDRHRDRATTLEEEADEKHAKADDLESEAREARERLAERRDELAETEEEVAAKREALAAEPVPVETVDTYREALAADLAALRERRGELDGELAAARERVAEARQLREKGRCPECGQPVEGSPHVEALSERRERVTGLEAKLGGLDGRIERLEAELERAERTSDRAAELEQLEAERESLDGLLDERETTIEKKESRIERLREEAAEHATEAEREREAAETAGTRIEECQADLADCDERRTRLSERRDNLEALLETLEEIEDLAERRGQLRDKRAERAERNDERRERLSEKRERRDELRESVDEARIEKAREKRQEAEAYLDRVEEKLAALADRRDKQQARLGAIENELEERSRLQDRRAELAATVENLDSLYGEAERLEAMYGDLRAELRRQNVETLERMLNETFELVYRNDSYDRLELDDEYRLRVVQKDGEELDPGQLSGGERALFNLSLRCAIYRLLAEGIEGTAPMPPLILDEPTVFLDSGHVSQLVELVDAMHELGVDQILVVSHDEELVAAADGLLRVSTDPTTNRSTVERTRAELPTAD